MTEKRESSMIDTERSFDIKGYIFLAILLILIYFSMFCQGSELDITTAGQTSAPACAGPCEGANQK